MYKKVVFFLDNDRHFIDRRIQHQIDALSAKYKIFFIRESELDKPLVEKGKNCDVVRITDFKFRKLVSKAIYYSNPKKDENYSKLTKGKNKILSSPTVVFYLLLNAHTVFSLLHYKLGIKRPLFKKTLSFLTYAFLLRWDVVFYFVQYLLIREKHHPYNLASKVNEIKTLLKNEEAPEIIHVHDLPSLELGVLLKKTFNAKLIYDSHEIYPEQFSYDTQRYKLEYERESKLIKNIDHLVSVNDYCVERIKEIHRISVPSTTISNSVKIDDVNSLNFATRQRIWHEKHKLAKNVIIAVFQGGINPVRNIDELVESLTHLPEHIHLGFITFAKDIPHYKKLCEKLKILHRVHFEIELDWEDVIDYLKSADFGFIPYQNTSDNALAATPNKMYEFLVANLPIIAGTNLPQVANFVAENNIGYVSTLSDSKSYATAFLNAIEWKKDTNPNLAEIFKSAQEKYSYSHEEENLFRIYEKLT